MNRVQRYSLTGLALSVLAFPAVAVAQVPHDPPTSRNPPPNVMTVFDATRTTLIDINTCGTADCHIQAPNCSSPGTKDSCDILRRGETRLQFAKRLATGGYAWNTNFQAGGQTADARRATTGIMDLYKVRWGVAYYDGVGTRIVRDPSLDNLASQKAVIDFGHTPNETLGAGLGVARGADRPLGTVPVLDMWVPYYRTVLNVTNTPAGYQPKSRQAQMLDYIRQYWEVGVDAPRFQATTITSRGTTHTLPAGADPRDEVVIDQDVSNVLVTNPASGGCRRNFTVVLLDGHGGDPWTPSSGGSSGTGGALTNGKAAEAIYDLPGGGGADLTSAPNRAGVLSDLSNQVFAIHFGPQDKPNADRIADSGFDGKPGGSGITTAFEGAPGGVINLNRMYAAFSAIMGLVLDGTYTSATPAVSRFGTTMITSQFIINSCNGVAPEQCNIGRPGELFGHGICQANDTRPACTGRVAGATFGPVWSAGAALRRRNQSNRDLFTGNPSGTGPDDTNCGFFATCGSLGSTDYMVTIPDPADPTEYGTRPSGASSVTNPSIWSGAGLKYNDVSFIRGDPASYFANNVFRGDLDCGSTGGNCCTGTPANPPALTNSCLDNHYKLADIANSKPVIVGGPGGIGEDLSRWNAFREMTLSRSSANISAFGGAPSTDMTVATRDQVVYVGGNDGFLHAFLAGRAKTGADTKPGRAVEYDPIGIPCTGAAKSYCDGSELWAYAPKMLQRNWPLLQSGHYFMVDGSPVVSDVLFTKNSVAGATDAPCTTRNCGNTNWEYRTVLLQCLGAGGPGCFAMDVTNPYDPQLLWERPMAGQITRATSTSRPQIVRVKRDVGGTVIPYYVGVMGGGLNETFGGVDRGTVVVMGLEDGRVATSSQRADADIAAAPTCLDTNNDSFVDTCYMVTTRASVYKVRFAGGNPFAGITMVKLFDGREAARAELGLASAPTIRAFSRIVGAFGTDGQLNLYYGTGDFEAVTKAGEQNYFFKIRDEDPDGALTAWTTARNRSRLNTCAGARSSTFPNAPSGKGVLPLTLGEKIMFDPVIAGGTVLFTSFQPNANQCLTGNAAVYGINYDSCAVGLDTNNDGTVDDDKVDFNAGGLLTAPAVNEETGTVYLASDSGQITQNAVKSPSAADQPMLKVWWREIIR